LSEEPKKGERGNHHLPRLAQGKKSCRTKEGNRARKKKGEGRGGKQQVSLPLLVKASWGGEEEGGGEFSAHDEGEKGWADSRLQSLFAGKGEIKVFLKDFPCRGGGGGERKSARALL